MLASSAIILVSEIVAARVIAPYVGLTLETFSAVIGCVLFGLSAGSGIGGWFADRVPARTMLVTALLVGGVWLIGSPHIVRAIGPNITPSGPTGALVLAAAAFFAPSLALSAVTPTVLRAVGRGSTRLGSVAGAVSAVGTAGALAGTFGAGFFLVGTLRSGQILAICGAACLSLAAATAYALAEPGSARAPGATALFVLAMFGSQLPGRLPCDAETQYACINIERIAPSTFHIRSDVYSSSVTNVADPTELHFAYLRDVATVVEAHAPGSDKPIRFSYVGAGGYTLPLHFEATYPNSAHVVYEIDQALVERVTAVLGIRDARTRFSTQVGDARSELANAHPDSADVIVGDAFSGITVPWQLTTREFLEDIRRVLAPRGIYVMNLVDQGDFALARAEVQTFREAFVDVAAVATADVLTGRYRGTANIVLLGSADLDVDALSEALRDRGANSLAVGGRDLDAFIGNAVVLSDDFAPVDQLFGRT